MSTGKPVLAGGIEAGGTKFVCIIGTGPDDIRARVTVPTTTPDETVGRCIDFFRQSKDRTGGVASVGIASFGPLDLAPGSSAFGTITSTPKPGWAGTDIPRAVKSALGVPAPIHTDVTGAALGEWLWGAGRGRQVVAYVTVGTGIGGGVVIDGKPTPGLLHAEMGHMRPSHERGDAAFGGYCPYHGDCLEGLASGGALRARWGQPYETLPADHPAHAVEAGYLAQLCLTLTAIVSPHVVILGGGVMKAPPLLPLIRVRTKELLAGYFRNPVLQGDLSAYLVTPGLGDDAGPLGALALAQAKGG